MSCTRPSLISIHSDLLIDSALKPGSRGREAAVLRRVAGTPVVDRHGFVKQAGDCAPSTSSGRATGHKELWHPPGYGEALRPSSPSSTPNSKTKELTLRRRRIAEEAFAFARPGRAAGDPRDVQREQKLLGALGREASIVAEDPAARPPPRDPEDAQPDAKR